MTGTEEMIARVLSETKLTLAGAARLIGAFQDSPPLHPATLARWVSRGVRLPCGRRVKLEAVRFGSKFVTSKEAVYRFLAAQTAGDTVEADAPRTPAARRRASERAAEELAAVGI